MIEDPRSQDGPQTAGGRRPATQSRLVRPGPLPATGRRRTAEEHKQLRVATFPTLPQQSAMMLPLHPVTPARRRCPLHVRERERRRHPSSTRGPPQTVPSRRLLRHYLRYRCPPWFCRPRPIPSEAARAHAATAPPLARAPCPTRGGARGPRRVQGCALLCTLCSCAPFACAAIPLARSRPPACLRIAVFVITPSASCASYVVPPLALLGLAALRLTTDAPDRRRRWSLGRPYLRSARR